MDRDGLQREIRLALASYEMDEPHWNQELFGGEEKSPYYPDVSSDEFEKMLRMDHCGDCIGAPAACPRCFAEAIDHKARWIADRVAEHMIANGHDKL